MHLVGAWSYGCTDGRMRLGEDASLSGSLDPNCGRQGARCMRRIYVSNMGGGNWRNRVRLATKLGEKGIKSEINFKKKKKKKEISVKYDAFPGAYCHWIVCSWHANLSPIFLPHHFPATARLWPTVGFYFGCRGRCERRQGNRETGV